ncbi:MAG: GDP-mannose 4,6-dehydratase [Ktedonobacteraceae bacterium]
MLNPSRILITGVSGFVGRHLAEKCRSRYPDAILYGTYRGRGHKTVESEASGIVPLVADVQSAEDMHEAIAQARPDLIFHLAAQSSVAASWRDPIGTLRVNAEGLLHLLEALRKEELMPRVIVVGSSEQYGNVSSGEQSVGEGCPFRPINPYGISKATQDFYASQYFAAYGLPIMRVRAFNHFGLYQEPTFVIASIARQIALIEAGKMEAVVRIGNVSIRRDFSPVEDVVNAYIAIAEHGYAGEAYNVGSGRSHSIGEIVDMLLQYASLPISIQEDPTHIRAIDQALLLADITQIRSHTQWEPACDIEGTLKQMLAYWRLQV